LFKLFFEINQKNRANLKISYEKENYLNNIHHVCFDLDGTIIDSNKTIYEATKYSLNQLKIEVYIGEEIFSGKIGQHFIDMFEAFEIEVPDFEKFINIYKENYFKFIDYSTVYPGFPEVLFNLKNRGIKISLLTTKIQDQADKIIDHFGLREYFDLVMGRRDEIAHKPSAEPLLLICKELSMQISNTLMVGDTELDIQCGKNAGALTCGLTYGYRTRELIEIENPDFILDSITSLETIPGIIKI